MFDKQERKEKIRKVSWNRNGRLCPNCGSPVSRQVPIFKVRTKRFIRLNIENPSISVNGEKRCFACSTYVKYLSCRNRRGYRRQGVRYLPYLKGCICPFSLAEQGWGLWQKMIKLDLVDKGNQLSPSDFVFFTRDFVSYWLQWFGLVGSFLSPQVKIKKDVGLLYEEGSQ